MRQWYPRDKNTLRSTERPSRSDSFLQIQKGESLTPFWTFSLVLKEVLGGLD